MAPSRPAPSLVVRTPRHASRRLRPALAAVIRRLAKERDGADIALAEKAPASDPGHALGVASDNASEWNSLLITARAERGPQWDVATQRFMVDYGSHLYFDPTPLTFPEERTPPPEDAPPQAQDPSPHAAQWQSDPRFAQFASGSMHAVSGLMNTATPARTSLRLQHQQHQQQQQQHQQHQQHPQQQQHPQTPLNGHALGNGIPSPHQYPYGLPNGRPQHFEPNQSFFDGGGQAHAPNAHHGMTNGMGASPMMRQSPMGMGMSGGVNMNMGNMSMAPMGVGSMEFSMGAHGVPETPSPGMRTRTRSQQDVNIGGW